VDRVVAGSKYHKGDEVPLNGPCCLCESLLLHHQLHSYWLLAQVLRPTRHKIGHFRKNIMFLSLKSISWLGMEEQDLTQQKHTSTNHKKCTTTQNKHKKN